MNIQRSRVIAYLLNEDPDVVVDLLNISSRELVDAFPERVTQYIEEESDDREDDAEEV